MYKLILAIRYLFRRPISYAALAAVTVAVFMVIVVMTVMHGLVADFKQKNKNFVGDCVISTPSLVGFPYYQDFIAELEKSDFTLAASPVIKNFALLTRPGGSQNIAVEIMGFDPEKHCLVTDFGRMLSYHQNCENAFEPDYDSNLPGFIAGIDLMSSRDASGNYALDAEPQKMTVSLSCFPLTARGALAKADIGLVNTKTLYYSDVAKSGLAGVDSSTIYLNLKDAQSLCGMAEPDPRINALYIAFKPGVNPQSASAKVSEMWDSFVKKSANEKLAGLLENVRVETWSQYKRDVIGPMEHEQLMLTFVFVMVGFITIFILFVIFYMIVSHKSKDIGIIKSIGASDFDVVQLFLAFAALVGIIGSAVGSVCGWLFLTKINIIENWLFNKFGFQLWDRTIYAIGEIPNKIDSGVLAIIIASAVIASVIGALVPVLQAAGRRTIETLQVSQL